VIVPERLRPRLQATLSFAYGFLYFRFRDADAAVSFSILTGGRMRPCNRRE
jgi:hypothetical protein